MYSGFEMAVIVVKRKIKTSSILHAPGVY